MATDGIKDKTGSPPITFDLPLPLRHAIESGECVLFVGAGIGGNVRAPDGSPAPDGVTLAKELAEYFSIDAGGESDLAKIAEVVQLRKGRTELEAFLKGRLAELEPDENLRWLFSLRWKAIFTTNYDSVIERAYELNPTPQQRPVTISVTADMVPFDARLDVPIYHLHGALFGRTNPVIVITQSDYARFSEGRRMLFELLKKEFTTSMVLYVGYSNRDPNWKMVRDQVSAEFFPSKIPPSYRISRNTAPLDVEILKASGIETFPASLDDFVRTASAELKELETLSDRLKSSKASIPTDLIPAYDKNPAAVLRLLASWTYVNQAPFDETPNTTAFLHGDRANWALIAKQIHFERDIEEDAYEDLLDYATSTSPKPKSSVIVAPAGYGVTTFLLTQAVRLVGERAGPVFMHKHGTSLTEGDIEFAASLFPLQRPFLIIDNAADHSGKIYSVMYRLRDRKKPAFLLLGERKNEWYQGRGKLAPKQLEIEPLSDPEIHRLLQCLSVNNALGVLESLDRDTQVAVIRRHHGKELLVTMREATEDKRFDAILEDEFRGIGDIFSQCVYLVVCAFYQHGAYVRDGLLAQLAGSSLTDLYERTKDSTEGVVIFDCIDESAGRYAARARHRTIASVVWQRCGERGEKERIIQDSVATLNLNYRADKEALEQFVRSDRTVDTIRTLDGKTKFFDSACRKDPVSPYIRQHYARMLAREEREELALLQIEEAIRLSSNIRILHHTKGVVLSQLAIKSESLDLARRRLAQAEQAFRRALSMYERDEYSYQALARLYLDWAKRVSDPEATEYIGKCEEIISQGLRAARTRDGLWIVSADVQKWLGDRPSHLQTLEKAVAETPGSVIARYLLGRAYRRNSQPQKTIEVLNFVVKNHPDEFRACIVYALALVDMGEPYAKAIAILRLGSLYGLNDPRFVATLGGMLFMNKDFTEAKKVFDEAVRQEFPRSEAFSVQFKPPDPKEQPRCPLKMNGKVIRVRAGYAFVEVPGYPMFLCPGSKFNGLVMRVGMKILFEPRFSAKGPLADKPVAL